AAPHTHVYATVSNAEPRYPPRFGVRSATMKAILDVEDGRIEVYDLVHDPREQRNVGPAAPGVADLVNALDEFRGRLAGRGTQLRLRATVERPVPYVVRITTDPPIPLVEVDRVGLEHGERVAVGEHSASLTVAGTLDPGDVDQVRMDVL